MGRSLGAWGVSLGTCGVPVNMGSLTLSLQVQNDQCQPTVEESRWMRTTEKGWEFHSVSVRREVTRGGRSLGVPPASLSPPVGSRCSTRLRRGRWVVTDGSARHPPPLVPAPSSAAGPLPMVPNPSLAVRLPSPLGSLSQVELSRGNNVLYWRTTAFSVWSKVPKPVLVRNIGITGGWGQEGESQGSRTPLPAT